MSSSFLNNIFNKFSPFVFILISLFFTCCHLHMHSFARVHTLWNLHTKQKFKAYIQTRHPWGLTMWSFGYATSRWSNQAGLKNLSEEGSSIMVDKLQRNWSTNGGSIPAIPVKYSCTKLQDSMCLSNYTSTKVPPPPHT
jgi:hypothetical protein